MFDLHLQAITDESGYCPNFNDLTDEVKALLLALACRCDSEEIREPITELLFNPQSDLFAEHLDAYASYKTEVGRGLVAAKFFESFIKMMAPNIQEHIDNFNEQVAARKSEPPRPVSDYL